VYGSALDLLTLGTLRLVIFCFPTPFSVSQPYRYEDSRDIITDGVARMLAAASDTRKVMPTMIHT
jgi:hypothetical protein